MIVIDDRLLLAVLSNTGPDDITAAVASGEVFTTGSWHYRLGRAVSAGTGTGALSGRFQALDNSVRQRVLASLEDLPDQLGMLSLRAVVPVMQALTVCRLAQDGVGLFDARAVSVTRYRYRGQKIPTPSGRRSRPRSPEARGEPDAVEAARPVGERAGETNQQER